MEDFYIEKNIFSVFAKSSFLLKPLRFFIQTFTGDDCQPQTDPHNSDFEYLITE